MANFYRFESRARQNLIFYALFYNFLGSVDISRIALIHSSICLCVVHKYDFFKLSYCTIIIKLSNKSVPEIAI